MDQQKHANLPLLILKVIIIAIFFDFRAQEGYLRI